MLDALPATLLFAAVVLVSIFFMFITSKNELAPVEDQSILFFQATAPQTATIEYNEAVFVINIYWVRSAINRCVDQSANGLGSAGNSGGSARWIFLLIFAEIRMIMFFSHRLSSVSYWAASSAQV